MLDVNKELTVFFSLLDEFDQEEDRLSRVKASATKRKGKRPQEGNGSAFPQKPVYAAASTVRARSHRTAKSSAQFAARRRQALRRSLLVSWVTVIFVIIAAAAVVIITRSSSQLGTLIQTSPVQTAAYLHPNERLLSVKTDPPGALVYVNDQLVGVSPFDNVLVPFGRHQLRVDKVGYAVVDSTLFVDSEQTLRFELVSSGVLTMTKEIPAFVGALRDTISQTLAMIILEAADSSATDTTAGEILASPDSSETRENGSVFYGSREAAPIRLLPPSAVQGGPDLAAPSELAPLPAVKRALDPERRSVRVAVDAEADPFDSIARKGTELFAEGRYEEAIEFFNRAARLRPGHPAVISQLELARQAASIDELSSAVFNGGQASK